MKEIEKNHLNIDQVTEGRDLIHLPSAKDPNVAVCHHLGYVSYVGNVQ